ncbi:hypothetical protein [Sphingopyxis macrogoltabida]|uniref:Uncharacterized protein n=1 Tax=Sphingopyxis macrogoltabida TaxID=33050 RepID=A0AAC8Z2C1_SPHMC|nr:hypothetical protein [Sphingopyxis macrogoltabida]ALJ14226.1 hypothetical protein LH19_15255 [Sphingopyxis macrogoltabida]AMU90491.1 hypothetical protein ATM17_15825 [Sphingopyxis macrogoltabida]
MDRVPVAPVKAATDRTLRLALITLAELVERVEDGPAPPTTATRLALAVCFQHSRGDREPFAHFWRTMRDPCAHQATETIARYCRTTYLMTSFRGVLRAVGIEPTATVEIDLRRAARNAKAARDAFDQAQKNCPTSR